MNDEKFQAYLVLRRSLPKDKQSGCAILTDKWFTAFLLDSPTEEQFCKIFNATIPDASIYYALWKVRA
jgi:hypothetical protein